MKWMKLRVNTSGQKAAKEHLKKLSNLTAGLESELRIAVGARIMLRCNLEISKGLVNGSLGTVVS